MKVIAVIEADYERGALGTRSRLGDALAGETVIRRTLRQTLAARRVASVHLVVPARQQAEAQQAAAGLAVRVETHEAAPVPWREHVAAARKWSLDAWRGGIGGATVFDESLNPWVVSALAQRESAEAVAAVPAGAALLDPGLLDEMIGHFEKVRDQMRMVFTQSAPGLSAAVYSPALLADLAATVQPPGRVMAYLPSDPRRDMVMQPCYYSPDPAIAYAAGRCIADTDEAFKRMERILSDAGGGGPDARAVSLRLAREQHVSAPLPAEVEIELTTDDPLPESTLRPRGAAVGRRGPMDAGLFRRLVEELSGRDDVRVVLGGFGDPLMHPDWPALLADGRRAGLFGLAVRTPAVGLDERASAALIDAHVDVLNVPLDAMTAGTYARVHGQDLFDRVVANLERFLALRQEARRAVPLLVCEMMKTPDTLAEMEAFYDHWISKTGSAAIAGPSAYGGRRPDLSVVRMAPPARFACGRVFNRALVLADGRVPACDQDFRGEHAIGSLTEASLADLWQGAAFREVRARQLDGTFASLPICAACEEWHRP
ncbi:MAG: hypothetical protein AMXMBFR83_19290 [Phycisphaerae bacterium]